MWVALEEQLQCVCGCVCLHTASPEQRVFMSLWLCLCSDSTDGLNSIEVWTKVLSKPCAGPCSGFLQKRLFWQLFSVEGKPTWTGLPWSRMFDAKVWWTWKKILWGERESQFSIAIASKTRRKSFKWSATSDVLFSPWRKLYQHQG